MPTISILKTGKTIEVPEGATLMLELLKAGLPVASSCQGDGICGKCKIEVVEGWENLSKIDSREEILSKRLRIKMPYRVSCQTKVYGDITLDTAYW